MDLPDALELGELPEHEANRFLHAPVGVLRDPECAPVGGQGQAAVLAGRGVC